MKKVLILLAAAAMMLVTGQSAKAQFYAGGSIGYSTTTMHQGDGTSYSGSSYKLLPEVGYQLNEKMAVGGTIGIMSGYAALGSFNPADLKGFLEMAVSAYSDFNSNDTSVSCTRFAPYFRYILFNTRHFDIFVDGVLAYNAIKMRENYDDTWRESNLTGIELAGRPGVRYNVDSNISIVAHLGSIGYQSLSVQNYNYKLTRMGLDLDSNNILIGFEYHF